MFITGLDEVGRGSIAGPVVAAAVNLPKGIKLLGLNDSKKLNKQQRELLCEKIVSNCDFGIGFVNNKIIDEIGIIKATNLAFLIALSKLSKKSEIIFIDGRDKFYLPCEAKFVIKGDQKIRAIMAASIVAKVWRDNLMTNHNDARLYGFNLHAGYGTILHRERIRTYGLSYFHRKTFCEKFLK